MKKTRIFILLALNLLLTNCNKEEKKVEETQTKVENTIVENVENMKIKFSDETYRDLEEFSKNKEEVIEKLKTSNKEEADKLYDEYYEKNIELLKKITGREPFFYNNMDYEDTETREKYQEAKKFFDKYGISVLGSKVRFELMVTSNFYYNIFKDYVSDEYRDYLELTHKDNDTDIYNMPTDRYMYQYEPVTPLTIQEVGDKIITFRKFLDKYPNTKFKNTFAVYVYYITDYMNFSLPFDEEGVEAEPYYEISEENMKEYKKFIEKNPNELASKCLEYLLENYKDKESSVIGEEIEKIIEKEMKEKFGIEDVRFL